MKVTFTIQNEHADWIIGGTATFSGIANLNPADAYEWLEIKAVQYPSYGIKKKIGDGSFRDRVTHNNLRRHTVPTMTIAPRKGYRLATFVY